MNQMIYRHANESDCPVLAQMNFRLIQDEGHRNPMTPVELEERMRVWLAGEYEAVIFERDDMAAAYALYRLTDEEIYLRQFFVVRNKRRQGLGIQALKMLFDQVWPKDKRILVEVLYRNKTAWAFWKAAGFSEYSLALEKYPGTGR